MSAESSSSKFDWPWQYRFPPFFTLQPNEETRRKQQDAWCQLVLDYLKHINQSVISIGSLRDAKCPLFSNKSIQRTANIELINVILQDLHSRGNLEWTDKSRKNARITWRSIDEWANIIEKWARDSGHGNSVCTLYELTDGENTEKEAFHGLDTSVLTKALERLQKRGKAELMGDSGVKFLCV